MKKLLSTICALLLCTYASAYDFEVDGIYYNILSEEEKTCEVTMNDKEIEIHYSGIVNIPTTANDYSVISIRSYAFFECTSLTNVSIPNSVLSIGNSAFAGCTNLTIISIPDNVTTIDVEAFKDCTSLCNITIPNKVTSISPGTFEDCSKLNNIIIPSSIKCIGDYAFLGCIGLKSITMPYSVESIGYDAFSGCNINEVNISCKDNSDFSAYLSRTDLSIFHMYELKGKTYNILIAGDMQRNISIPNSITNIPKFAFTNFSNVTSITIPNSVTSINSNAFQYCNSIKNISIPSSVKNIENYSFYGCTGLKCVYIPCSVTRIGEHVFDECTSLRKVFNNSSLELTYGQYGTMFPNAPCIYTNCIPEISGDFLLSVYDDGKKYVCDYYGEETDITLPTVYGVDEYAFGFNYNIKNVTIPNSIKTIRKGSFYNCSGLTIVTIPNELNEIGSYSFYNCTQLTSIRIPDNVTTLNEATFAGCSNLTSINLNENITSIGSSCFNNCYKIKSITIPESIESIGSYAFCDCSNLNSINIPNRVTSIGAGSFKNCTELKNINIPNGITSILAETFQGSGITSLIIPNSVTSIGFCSFIYCYNLESIYLPNSVTYIGPWAFSDCPITNITIPSSVESIDDAAFQGCDELTSITNLATIPQTITSGTFPSNGVTLHVLPGYKDIYKSKDNWNMFVIKDDVNSITIIDGDVYECDVVTNVNKLSYSRSYNNTNWQALYVPFSMSYDDFSDKLEIAWLNNVHMYDDNNDGDPDRTMLEFYVMHDGETSPNTPYLVRSKETGTFNLTKINVDIYPSECDQFECSTFYQTFTVRGTYSGVSGADMYSNRYYAPVNGKLSFASSSNASLKPQRWYIKVTNKDGSNVTNLAPSIRMSIDGEVIEEAEETGICSTIDYSRTHKIYSLDGRSISKPSNRGMFVQNNKIVIVK